MVWFGLDIGREKNADPRWLLPLICRVGDITKSEIGTIRIDERESRFEIVAADAERFADSVKASPHKEGHIWRIGAEAGKEASEIRSPDKRREAGKEARQEAGNAARKEPRCEARYEARREAPTGSRVDAPKRHQHGDITVPSTPPKPSAGAVPARSERDTHHARKPAYAPKKFKPNGRKSTDDVRRPSRGNDTAGGNNTLKRSWKDKRRS